MRTQRSSTRATPAGYSGPVRRTFDGPFATCLTDIEDALRSLLVEVGEVSGIAVMIELSLPALKRRVRLGDRLQPAWNRFQDGLAQRYGLPCAPVVRYLREDGPLAALVVAYRT